MWPKEPVRKQSSLSSPLQTSLATKALGDGGLPDPLRGLQLRPLENEGLVEPAENNVAHFPLPLPLTEPIHTVVRFVAGPRLNTNPSPSDSEATVSDDWSRDGSVHGRATSASDDSDASSSSSADGSSDLSSASASSPRSSFSESSLSWPGLSASLRDELAEVALNPTVTRCSDEALFHLEIMLAPLVCGTKGYNPGDTVIANAYRALQNRSPKFLNQLYRALLQHAEVRRIATDSMQSGVDQLKQLRQIVKREVLETLLEVVRDPPKAAPKPWTLKKEAILNPVAGKDHYKTWLAPAQLGKTPFETHPHEKHYRLDMEAVSWFEAQEMLRGCRKIINEAFEFSKKHLDPKDFCVPRRFFDRGSLLAKNADILRKNTRQQHITELVFPSPEPSRPKGFSLLAVNEQQLGWDDKKNAFYQTGTTRMMWPINVARSRYQGGPPRLRVLDLSYRQVEHVLIKSLLPAFQNDDRKLARLMLGVLRGDSAAAKALDDQQVKLGYMACHFLKGVGRDDSGRLRVPKQGFEASSNPYDVPLNIDTAHGDLGGYEVVCYLLSIVALAEPRHAKGMWRANIQSLELVAQGTLRFKDLMSNLNGAVAHGLLLPGANYLSGPLGGKPEKRLAMPYADHLGRLSDDEVVDPHAPKMVPAMKTLFFELVSLIIDNRNARGAFYENYRDSAGLLNVMEENGDDDLPDFKPKPVGPPATDGLAGTPTKTGLSEAERGVMDRFMLGSPRKAAWQALAASAKGGPTGVAALDRARLVLFVDELDLLAHQAESATFEDRLKGLRGPDQRYVLAKVAALHGRAAAPSTHERRPLVTDLRPVGVKTNRAAGNGGAFAAGFTAMAACKNLVRQMVPDQFPAGSQQRALAEQLYPVLLAIRRGQGVPDLRDLKTVLRRLDLLTPPSAHDRLLGKTADQIIQNPRVLLFEKVLPFMRVSKAASAKDMGHPVARLDALLGLVNPSDGRPLQFFEAPPLLTITASGASGSGTVVMPESLTLAKTAWRAKPEPPRYRLRAFIHHQGRDPGGGTYSAGVRRGLTWRYHADGNVGHMASHPATARFKNTGVLYFYELVTDQTKLPNLLGSPEVVAGELKQMLNQLADGAQQGAFGRLRALEARFLRAVETVPDPSVRADFIKRLDQILGARKGQNAPVSSPEARNSALEATLFRTVDPVRPNENLLVFGALRDGNCAFNAFAITLMGLVAQGALPRERVWQVLSTLEPRDGAISRHQFEGLCGRAVRMNGDRNWADSKVIQETLAAPLRSLALNHLARTPALQETVWNDFWTAVTDRVLDLYDVDHISIPTDLWSAPAAKRLIEEQAQKVRMRFEQREQQQDGLPPGLKIRRLEHFTTEIRDHEEHLGLTGTPGMYRSAMVFYLNSMRPAATWVGAPEVNALAAAFGIHLSVLETFGSNTGSMAAGRLPCRWNAPDDLAMIGGIRFLGAEVNQLKGMGLIDGDLNVASTGPIRFPIRDRVEVNRRLATLPNDELKRRFGSLIHHLGDHSSGLPITWTARKATLADTPFSGSEINWLRSRNLLVGGQKGPRAGHIDLALNERGRVRRILGDAPFPGLQQRFLHLYDQHYAYRVNGVSAPITTEPAPVVVGAPGAGPTFFSVNDLRLLFRAGLILDHRGRAAANDVEVGRLGLADLTQNENRSLRFGPIDRDAVAAQLGGDEHEDLRERFTELYERIRPRPIRIALSNPNARHWSALSAADGRFNFLAQPGAALEVRPVDPFSKSKTVGLGRFAGAKQVVKSPSSATVVLKGAKMDAHSVDYTLPYALSSFDIRKLVPDYHNQDCVALVNGAIPSLQGGAGMDADLHRLAGDGLKAACRGALAKSGDPELAVGHAVATGAGALASHGVEAVIHTVAPKGGSERDVDQLRLCVRSVLTAVRELKPRPNTLVMNNIRPTDAGYTTKQAAAKIKAAVAYLLNHDFKELQPLKVVFNKLPDVPPGDAQRLGAGANAGALSTASATVLSAGDSAERGVPSRIRKAPDGDEPRRRKRLKRSEPIRAKRRIRLAARAGVSNEVPPPIRVKRKGTDLERDGEGPTKKR